METSRSSVGAEPGGAAVVAIPTINLFAAAWSLLRSAVRALLRNKRLMVLPLLAVVSATSANLLFVIPAALGSESTGNNTVLLIGALAGVYAATCAVVFCNVALVFCAGQAMAGEPVGIAAGLRCAAQRLPLILGWAAVLLVVGLVLQTIERQGTIGRYLRRLLGALWSLATFFVVQVIVYERPPLGRLVPRSLDVLRRGWTAGVGYRVRLFWLVVLLAAAPLVGLALLIGPQLGDAAAHGLTRAGMLVFAIAIAVGSALDHLVRTALYVYATDDAVAEGFDESALHSAVQPRSRWFALSNP